jgi:histidine triad (HIT) family protein
MHTKIYILLIFTNTNSLNLNLLKKQLETISQTQTFLYIKKNSLYIISISTILLSGIYLFKKNSSPKFIPNKQIKSSIRYSKDDEKNMHIEFNEFLYATNTTTYKECFKNFVNNKNLRQDLKNKINAFVKENKVNNSEFLIKKDDKDEINFVINSEINKENIFTNTLYNKNNRFYNIIHKQEYSKIYYENNNFMLIQNRGTDTCKNLHLLLIPKNNYITYVDFFQKANDEEIKDFFEVLYKIYNKYNLDQYPTQYKKRQNDSFLYINHNNGVFKNVRGDHSNQYVYHLHLHIQYLSIFKENFIKDFNLD